MDNFRSVTARMHMTGPKTAAKLVENMMNNTPYGYNYGRGKGKTKLMELS